MEVTFTTAVFFGISGLSLGLGVHLLTIGRWTGRIDSNLTRIDERHTDNVKRLDELKGLLEERRRDGEKTGQTFVRLEEQMTSLQEWIKAHEVRIKRLEDSGWKQA